MIFIHKAFKIIYGEGFLLQSVIFVSAENLVSIIVFFFLHIDESYFIELLTNCFSVH